MKLIVTLSIGIVLSLTIAWATTSYNLSHIDPPSVLDVSDRLSGIMDGNQVSTLIYNHGSIGRPNTEPSFEWKSGSGHGYAYEFGFIVGTKVESFSGEPIHFVIDGLAVGGVLHGSGGYESNDWQPVPGITAGTPNTEIAMSDNQMTWPSEWINWPSIDNSTTPVGDLESYYVMNDRHNARHSDEYQAINEDSTYLGSGIEVSVRGYQWNRVDLEDILLQVYEVTNISSHHMDSIVVGMWGDPHMGGPGNYRDDNAGFFDSVGYDPITGETIPDVKNLIYCWDTDSVGDESFDGDTIGYFGVHILPHNDSDYFKTISVKPWSSSGASETEWWARFAEESPNPVNFTQDADNLILWGTDFFSLGSGESRMLFVAFLFGDNKEDLTQNAIAVDNQKNIAFESFVGVETLKNDTFPQSLRLLPAYPNPFNPSITINYELFEAGLVELIVFDINGKMVTQLLRDNQTPGIKSVRWAGTDDLGNSVGTGIYFCRIKTNTSQLSQKMILLR